MRRPRRAEGRLRACVVASSSFKIGLRTAKIDSVNEDNPQQVPTTQLLPSFDPEVLQPGRIKYSTALAERICAAISTSLLGLHRICAAHPDFPRAETIVRWCDSHPDFAQRYARARVLQANLAAHEAVLVAYTPEIGQRVEYKEVGRECTVCKQGLEWRSGWKHADGSLMCVGATPRKVYEEKVSTGDMIEARRAKIESLRWLAAKLAPQHWGEQLSLNQRLVDENGKDRPFTLADYDAMIEEAEKKLAVEKAKSLIPKALPAPEE
jgi:hypothetical protein